MLSKQTKQSILDAPVLERAIIYARVSTDEQAKTGTSLDNQVEQSLAYAEANNMQIVAVFREDYTGKFLDRPELNKARDMLRSGQADNLIVYKPNRLDRSEWGVNLLLIMQELKAQGVSLHYSQQKRPVDLHNPMEAFMYGSFAGWQAGEDHRETVTKLHEGRINRAKSGYVVPAGTVVYGYDKVKIDGKWYLEINESQARIVRLIFQWYVVGDETGETLSLSKIAQKFNDMNILSPSGKGQWWRATISRFLKDETYAGVWNYLKTNEEAENIPVEVPAIVPREQWEAAQEQLKKNVKYARRNRKEGRYLLARRIVCGSCGAKMTGATREGGKYIYYYCSHRWNNEAIRECNNPMFKADVVDAMVWGIIEEAARDKDRLIAGLESYQAQQDDKIEPIRRDLALVEQLIEEKSQELNEEIENLSILSSKRAKAKKAADIERIEGTLDGLEARQAELEAKVEETSITDDQIIGIAAFAAQVAKDLDVIREAEAKGEELPEVKKVIFKAKRQLLDMLDVEVTLFVEDGIRKAKITAKYCPENSLCRLRNTQLMA